MRLRHVSILGLLILLSACGSRLNPVNWFGSAEQSVENVAATPSDGPLDPLAGLNLVAEVTDLQVEQLPPGAIVRAEGLPPRQGFWQPELVALGVEDGVILYAYVISEPPGETPAGPPQSRALVVATSLSNQDLAALRAISVASATNRLTSRR